MNNDYFELKAENYDQAKNRVENVENIAQSLLRHVMFDKTMHILDFGSGTGLLSERIAPFVAKITAVDVSRSMNQQFETKRETLDCDLEILELDLAQSELEQKFDGIISSMTMHHVDDTQAMFTKFYAMLNDEGVLALADLDVEDGTFHTSDTGVYHFGFDRNEIMNLAIGVGFKQVDVMSASIVHKPQGNYPVFLLTARK